MGYREHIFVTDGFWAPATLDIRQIHVHVLARWGDVPVGGMSPQRANLLEGRPLYGPAYVPCMGNNIKKTLATKKHSEQSFQPPTSLIKHSIKSKKITNIVQDRFIFFWVSLY